MLEAAVIGIPDEKWGERPKAFVLRKPGAEVNEAELIGYLQTHIARYKVPKAVEFVDAAAAHGDRQDPEVRAPREGMGRPQQPDPGMRRHDDVGRRDLRRDALATTAIGRSLGTDYFGLRDELTEAERDYLRAHPGLRRHRGAARSSTATGNAPSSRGS